jgi:hypothetical protein
MHTHTPTHTHIHTHTHKYIHTYIHTHTQRAGLPTNVIQISGGEAHTFALTSDHRIYGVGNDLFGQLGLSLSPETDSLARTRFAPMTKLETAHTVFSIVTGSSWTIALRRILTVPILDPPPGVYSEKTLVMSHSTPGVDIYYTVDVHTYTAASNGGGPETLDIQKDPGGYIAGAAGGASKGGLSLNQAMGTLWGGSVILLNSSFAYTTAAQQQQSIVYTVHVVRAFAACPTSSSSSGQICGQSSSPVVTAGYYIYPSITPPTFRRSAEGVRTPEYVCMLVNATIGGACAGTYDTYTCGRGGVCIVHTGVWYSEAVVEMYTQISGAKIWYSFGGETPAEGKGTLYTGPFKMDQRGNLTIMAVAVLPGMCMYVCVCVCADVCVCVFTQEWIRGGI